MENIINSKMNQFSYGEWNAYFAENDDKRLELNFSKEKGLTEAEKELIFPSIRAFQKGEGSDGGFLMHAVEKFVRDLSGSKNGKNCNLSGSENGKIGNLTDSEKSNELCHYREAMLWFVKEENYHSAYLKKYMNFYQVCAAEHSFLDKVFRFMRKLGSLKCEVTILVTAEMIALTYYDALKECVDSPALNDICGQMLQDELPHIMFQSHTLSYFENSFAYRLMRILIMEVTLLFVWSAFHKVYRAGGYTFGRFLKENLGYLRQSMYLVKKLRQKRNAQIEKGA